MKFWRSFLNLALTLLAIVALVHLTRFVDLEAAHNVKRTNLAANTEADAVCALLNSGFLDIYDGSQPATADTAVTTQNVLASLTLNATACGASSGGIATFNSITGDSDANATGTATWARFYKSNHTTAVYDISVCVAGCDLNLSSAAIVIHEAINVSTLTYTANKG